MNDEKDQPIERGGSEEAAGAPLTPAEEETLRRPAGVTPGVTPGAEDADEEDEEGDRRMRLGPHELG
ncbi:hypothetical protein AB0K12_41100 [Nonomuraea sp. NPDC049419]|uniref:hypothetical protein n=1 Tax=Nonomuraea sp. NPDC049419 TaxID=3155772 RepID=UPI003417CCFD